jgi:hypothetical protein
MSLCKDLIEPRESLRKGRAIELGVLSSWGHHGVRVSLRSGMSLNWGVIDSESHNQEQQLVSGVK